MTEDEYIVATDLAKVRAARRILEDVMSITTINHRSIRVALAKLEDELHKKVGVLDVAE